MEVHHPHHLTHKKKWSEYILEFIMLFTALTLGFFAENLREGITEKHKAIESVQNLYKDLIKDSISYENILFTRRNQDSCFKIISDYYEEGKLEKKIPLLYVAHSNLTYRLMPIMNTMALDQIKNSGTLNYIEDNLLKQEIQSYANDANNLFIRGQREAGFIDRMVDPITTTRFQYKLMQGLSINDSIQINGKEIISNIVLPTDLKIVKQATFDWDNYFSILGMLQTIRNGTDRFVIVPTQNKCNKLIALVRKYLIDNDSLIEE